ncbi:MAG: hypothetical protein IPM82_25145 [Saprospiraceae bacterium]|nr:hypothetical protein [Saprospiraceae bacterium]
MQRPLWIVHQRLADVSNNNDVSGYEVLAQIKHRSGIANAEVFYTIDTTQAYQPLPLQNAGNGDNWTSIIPHQPNGSQVFYYISATANSSKTQVKPLAAPMGYYDFTVNDEVSLVNETGNVELAEIYPNPASAMTVVPVNAAVSLEAKLEILDVFGRKVTTIFEGKNFERLVKALLPMPLTYRRNLFRNPPN